MNALATVLVLYLPIRWSVLASRPLYSAVFLAVFGISVILTQSEAILFLEMTREHILAGIMQQTLGALWLTFVAWGIGARSVDVGDDRPVHGCRGDPCSFADAVDWS
ncbi:MAG TPA: hypothetical protein VE175_08415 [Woeseiaceae bacterium]|jgi:hypothetical protein|nr:hypothetical protein [Woeseiaceae bacterium]